MDAPFHAALVDISVSQLDTVFKCLTRHDFSLSAVTLLKESPVTSREPAVDSQQISQLIIAFFIFWMPLKDIVTSFTNAKVTLLDSKY